MWHTRKADRSGLQPSEVHLHPDPGQCPGLVLRAPLALGIVLRTILAPHPRGEMWGTRGQP